MIVAFSRRRKLKGRRKVCGRQETACRGLTLYSNTGGHTGTSTFFTVRMLPY